MIASVVLVAVAFVTLVAGWLGRVDPLIFASIVASVLAGAMLVASVVRPGRRKAATMAGHAPALAPVGDGPPKPPAPPAARAGEEPVTWSGTVRTTPSSAPAGVLSGEGKEAGLDEPDVTEVDHARGFLDDDLEALTERDVFADVEDAELVDDTSPDLGGETLPPSGEARRLARPPSFPQSGRPARAEAASQPESPAAAEPLLPTGPPEPQGDEEGEPEGPRILYGRPLVTPPGEEPATAAMRGRRKPAPGKLVGPATASRPRVAGPADRSRAPKPPAAKAAPAKPAVAKAGPAKPAPSSKPAPLEKPRPMAKPVARSPVKPASKPAAKPAPKPAPKAGPQATAAAAMPRRKPVSPPPPSPSPPPSPPEASGPAAPKPAPRPPASRPRPRPIPARPEDAAPPAATERPAPGDARPSPRTRISFLGNRPPAPKSPPPTDEPS